MSHLPANMYKIDPTKLIVIIETSTGTLKSTFKTLTARPSFLATYPKGLVASTKNASAGPSRPRLHFQRGMMYRFILVGVNMMSRMTRVLWVSTCFSGIIILASTGVIKPAESEYRLYSRGVKIKAECRINYLTDDTFSRNLL